MSSDPHAAGPALVIADVGKVYQIYDRPQDRLKQALYRGRRQFYRQFWALRHVSFEVQRGETLGIVGRNGAGKSTLLQIICGTLTPSEGRVQVRGRVAALLELGSGFNSEFTGRENVYMNGAILGLSRREIDARFDRIAGFADIGQFLDQPVKTYSSGMVVRLAFAVQVQVEPDVLIVDEALAVGDLLFQKRCFQRLRELREQGCTILFVSHDLESVRSLTDRAVFLRDGHADALGPPGEVIRSYRRFLLEEEYAGLQAATARSKDLAPREALAGSIAPMPPSPIDHLAFGHRAAEIVGVRILDGDNRQRNVYNPGETLRLAIACQVNADLTHLNVAFRLVNKQGVRVTSWGTLNADIVAWARGRAEGAFWERVFRSGERFTVVFSGECILGSGFYEVQALVSREHDRYYRQQEILHYRDEAAFFSVHVKPNELVFGGICNLQMTCEMRFD